MSVNLTNNLVVNHKKFFKTQLAADIKTPEAFEYPLAVRLEGNQLMLLWAASQGERSIWAQAFKDTMVPDETQKGESVPK